MKKEKKSIREKKKKWEEDFWLLPVDEVKEAERRGDIRTKYKKLRDIDFRDLKTIEEEKSTPEQFRNQFKAVSENRFERRVEELMTTTSAP